MKTTLLIPPARALVKQMGKFVAVERERIFQRALEIRDPIDLAGDVQTRVGPTLGEMARELDTTLMGTEVEKEIDEELLGKYEAGGSWSLGSELQVFASRKILRGYLVPARTVPTRVPVSVLAFAFLTITGDEGLLARDNDHGIHYHYVLPSRQRTTTMICWDNRWISADSKDPQGLKDRPLFHELHGEGRYTKLARVDQWGDEKRKSVRQACVPDLSKNPVGSFRCASNDAEGVWPRGGSVTPRPSTPAKKRRR